MADLELKIAQRIAGGLVTIGHPYSPAAIDATAFDLMRWCTGAIIDGRVWSPEQQAEALVTEVRETWEEWPDRGGTRKLLALFREKYAPPAKQYSEGEWVANLIKTGALAAPCEHCQPGDSYCEYGGPKRHAAESARAKAQAALPKVALPKKIDGFHQVAAAKTLTPDQMRQALEADIQRKQEQLRRLELD